MSSTSRIPSYTEVYTTSPTAAGLPVLEVVRRLEEEKLITKDDRMALKDGLYSSDVVRREEIVKALCEVELSMNSRFSIRRLKAVIHQNGGGEVSSKQQHKPAPATLHSSDLESSQPNHNNTLITGNNGLQLAGKADARPSKYRTKQKNHQSPDGCGSPARERTASDYSTHSAGGGGHVHGNGTASSQATSVGASGYVPSSSGAVSGSGAPLRLFPSPTSQTPVTHSAREKGLPPHSSSGAAPGTAEPLVIHYTNNNVPMGSPKTSRSRTEDGVMYTNTSPPRAYSNYTPSSSSHTNHTTPLLSNNPAQLAGHTATSSGTSSTSNYQYAPNSGRGPRISPYRSHPDNSAGNSNAISHNNNNDNNGNNAEEDTLENISTINAINQAVGNQAVYSGPDCFHNVLTKVAARLSDFYAKYDVATRGRRRLAVLVGGGSFNPLTRMHLRTYFLAKQCLEAKYGYVVLGSLLSPAHGATVRERYRTNPSEIIPSPHRLAVAQLLVQNSKLLSVDPWEITRRRAMDYLSLLEHVAAIINEQFEGVEIKVLFVCKPNMVPKLSPQALRDANFGVVTVCRTPESDLLRNTLTAKWNGVITVVEDTAILDASMDIITSRRVRDKMKLGHSVEQLVGEKINDYVQIHHLGQKMNGTEKWESQEKLLPSLASRPAVPTLTSQFNKMLLSQSQAQQGSVMSTATSNTAGEYSPDRLLLPINELTTLNMSAHNSAYTSNASNNGNHRGQVPVSGSKAAGSNHSTGSAYTPSWMAEQDV